MQVYIIEILDNLGKYSSLFFLLLAIYGVDEWRRQLKGKTNYETAKKYKRSILNLREAIRVVRQPFISVDEMYIALKEFNLDLSLIETDGQKTNKVVYTLRWKKVTEAMMEVQNALIDAEVLWGEKILSVHKPLDDLVRELYASLSLFLRDADKDDLIYDIGEKDKYSKKIMNTIENIEKYLNKYMK